MNKPDCIFCKIAQRAVSADITHESVHFMAIRDIHPKALGHTLIIPKSHGVTILDISQTLGQELLGIIQTVCSDVLDKKFGNGFNIVMNNLEVAGQIIPHAHIHIIPRTEGDGLRSLV